MEIRYRRKNLTPEEKVRIATDYNAGMPTRDICNRYSVSRMTIYRTLKAMAKKEEDEQKETN